MGRQSLCPATATVTGVQSYESRFGQRRSEYFNCPPLAQWRCNLTGLSQVHNLYFIAYGEWIYCYIPQFPSQEIALNPALVIASQASSPNLIGGTDPRRPHAINNLVVQHLGIDEIIAVVRDDGDVDAFLVRHIVQAIERRAEPESRIGILADDVRPMFKRNVGKSAWSLAIHSQARIIAVGANSHNVTVFKFGLIEQDDEAEPTSHGRQTDVVEHIVNGLANIPHIAFCNTGDDPDGRWLLTTDVSGNCRTMDLLEMTNAQTFRFGDPGPLDDFDHLNPGWGTMFLDRRSFMPETSVEAALGLEANEVLPGLEENRSLWDIGRTAAHIPDVNKEFLSQRKASQTSPSAGDAPAEQNVRVDRGSDTTGTSDVEPTMVTEQSEMDVDSINGDGTSTTMDEDASSNPDEPFLFDSDDDLDDEDSLFEVDYDGNGIRNNRPLSTTLNNLCGDLPCPILHASARNVYLLQPSDKRGAEQEKPFTSPTIGFTNGLKQRIEVQYTALNRYERLNLHAYIPSIGVLILASQKGRALVISLTCIPKSTPYPPGMVVEQQRVNPDTVYAMRIDQVLPYGEQEHAGVRPFVPLAGIAVGPMQGTARLPVDQRRWRLLMMYYDHSILSYEIRRCPTRDSGVDVASLMI